MKTALDINDQLLADAKALAAQQRTSLTRVLRLVSSPKIFQHPTPVEDALAFVDALLAAQGVHLASLGPEWPHLRQLCIDKRLKGNAVPDAWLVAATLHLAEHLVSFERDFRK